jgi:beta-lactamase class A
MALPFFKERIEYKMRTFKMRKDFSFKVMKLFAILFLIIYLPIAWSATNDQAMISRKIKKISADSHSQVGVSAIHIETGKRIAYRGDNPFFMASTVKVPIALILLRKIDAKQDKLNRLITVKEDNAVPGSGELFAALKLNPKARTYSLKQLLSLMMEVSDNTATDLILHEIEGPRLVSKRLKKLGFKHITINRSIYELYLSSSGLPCTTRFSHIASLQRTLCKIAPGKKAYAWKRFQNDYRDTATPNEMALLLSDLYKGQLLSDNSTKLLLKMMTNCQTGKHRIKGLLPPNTKVAHKTGTWTDNFSSYSGYKELYRYANDIGIITLPGGKGHVAIAVFVRSKNPLDQQRDQVIAKISREIFNYFK